MTQPPEVPNAQRRPTQTIETDPEGRRLFRRNLVRVMAVQVISLIVLWLLQRHYTI